MSAAGGDFWKMKSANGKTVTEMFAGGTAAGAENTSAKIGTIAGNFEDALASAGEKMLNGLNPALDWLIEKSDGAADALGGVFDGIGATFTNLMGAVQPLAPAFNVVASVVGGALSLAFSSIGSVLNNLVIPVFGAVGSVFQFGVDVANALFPKMDGVGTVAEEVGKLFKGLGSIVENVTGGIRDLGGAIGNVVGNIKDWVLGKLGKHATGAMAYGGLTQINENMKGELIRLPNGSRIYPYETTRRLLKNEYKAANKGGGMRNTFNIHVDARGSNLTAEQIYRLKRGIVQDIVDAFDNMVPA